MNFFAILRRHVVHAPGDIAWQSARRTFTYRRFWSRIERATARLKGEWHVGPGDTVAYIGCGHPDALILYLAVARCGARLLPLEHAVLQNDAADILGRIPAVLLLHDDAIVANRVLPVPMIATLSTLIATRCHFYPTVEEDDLQPSLLSIAVDDGVIRQDERSLQSLCRHLDGDATGGEYSVAGALFDGDILGPHVLSTLAARGTVYFR